MAAPPAVMPDEFKRISDIVRSYTISAVKNAENELREAAWRLATAANNSANFTAALSEQTVRFLATGIASPHPDFPHAWSASWVRWGMHSRFGWYSYFLTVAKQARRPFVWYGGPASYHCFTIQRRKYTEPLVGAFLLACDTVHEDEYSHNRDPNPVSILRTPTLWKVRTKDSELADQWLHNCQFDPTYRRALRLPV